MRLTRRQFLKASVAASAATAFPVAAPGAEQVPPVATLDGRRLLIVLTQL
jgi:anaerobic selenocysteine-containing dehydrogenase